jgi:thiamine-phosphate pyrophosphorylase
MHKKLQIYYFINEFDYSHLINLDKNISFIWRNKNKETLLKTLKELRNFCNKNGRKLYVNNDIHLAQKIGADGLYISSNNKNLTLCSGKLKKKFKILGSAHNIKEIKIKEIQNVAEIFISPLFKDKKNKKLDVFRYLNLRKATNIKDIALGGIDEKNLKRLRLIDPAGFAGISYFEKKKGPQ